MKDLSRLLLLVFVACSSLSMIQAKTKSKPPKPCSQGRAFRGCPACGKTTRAANQKLNVLKNRAVAVTNPKEITVEKIRKPANDVAGERKKFKPTDQVSVTGFVASVDPGGCQETCNCKRTDLRDVHINVVADQSEAGDKTKYVVVEFTPRWEKKFHFDDSNYEAMRQKVEDEIKGKRVKFSGWMMYDFIHEKESKSTAPDASTCPDFPKTPCPNTQPPQAAASRTPCVWRATPWEVHPVTAFTIVSGP